MCQAIPLIKFSISITVEIQRNITQRGKRNPLSKRYHEKDDKEAIAAWRLNLNGVRQVFNVRSVTPAWPLLTVYSQKELGINMRTTASSALQDSVKKRTIATGIHRDVLNAEIMVPQVRRDVSSTYRQGVDGENQAVGAARTQPTIA